MADQSPQPSAFVFPAALQPAEPELYAPEIPREQGWGWIELFVLAQVFWGVLLFIPGSQSFRFYIRAFPYVASLIAVIGCARSNSTNMQVPGAGWILAALLLLIGNLVHEETWFTAGVAQVIFQLAIAAPVFWAARMWLPAKRIERLILLIFAANCLSAVLGLLQVYYPAVFMPPQFSTMAYQMNRGFLAGMSYVGAGDRLIIRPPGLTDLPGGAAISGTFVALIGFALAVRQNQTRAQHVLFYGSVIVGMTVVYLTQVRSMLLMILGGMMMVAFIRLRQGRVVQSTYIATSAAVLLLGSFLWAVTLGGDVIQERFGDIYNTGIVRSYGDNRGMFLSYAIYEQPFEYPFGAGLGRWGMMSAYFPEPGNWQYPSLYAEIQPTGWIYDGGILMCIFYPAALIVAMRYAYKVAIDRDNALSDAAIALLVVQLLVAGLCFTGPVFNTQVGIMFWLATALLYGSERTLLIQDWQAQAEAEAAAEDDVEMAGEAQELQA